MQFTLDSVVQFETALEKKNKGKKALREAVLVDDLNQLKENNGNYYFGVFSVGSNVAKYILYNENDVEIITISTNSQVVDYFSSVKFFDDADLEVTNPFGHFRGFELSVR